MHDISYAYGFDETNGNFNKDYGRFDELTAEDPFKSWNDDEVLAEAQDGQGLNNANFAPC
jgi:hypothetical protein